MNELNPQLYRALPIPPSPRLKSGWARALLFLVLLIALKITGELIIYVVLGDSFFDNGMPSFDEAGLIAVFLISGLLDTSFVFLFRRTIDRRSILSLGFGWNKGIKKDLIAGLLFGLGLLGVVFSFLVVTGLIEIAAIGFPAKSLGIVFVVFVLVAFQEELVTRGYLLNNLMQSLPKPLALLLVSLIFGVAHIFNPDISLIAIFNIVLAGILLGIYYIHRKNLWFPIGLHLSWNFAQGAIFGSPVSGVPVDGIFMYNTIGSDLLTGGRFGFEGSIVTTIVMMLAITVLHFFYRDKTD